MSELEAQHEQPPEQQSDDHEEHADVAKNAMIFSFLWLLLLIGLWGYVYLTLLERGLTQ